jgi:general secretion pathway protein G
MPLIASVHPHRSRGFTIIEVMMVLGILSLTIAAVVPRITGTKRQALAAAVGNDLRTFAAAFDTYAQEKGSFPAEVEAGILPPEMADRLNNSSWLRMTPIGGHYNWDFNQMHQGVRYRAVIQISDTENAPLPEDVELWEAIDKIIDDGNLNTGNFRLGAENQPIFIVSP